MNFVQIGIVFFGVFAIWLSQSDDPRYQRYACLFGLAGQPFWFYATASQEQWGMFALCVLYCIAWGRGAWVHWLREWRYG